MIRTAVHQHVADWNRPCSNHLSCIEIHQMFYERGQVYMVSEFYNYGYLYMIVYHGQVYHHPSDVHNFGFSFWKGIRIDYAILCWHMDAYQGFVCSGNVHWPVSTREKDCRRGPWISNRPTIIHYHKSWGIEWTNLGKSCCSSRKCHAVILQTKKIIAVSNLGLVISHLVRWFYKVETSSILSGFPSVPCLIPEGYPQTYPPVH